jgi:hypothetical protein
MIGSITLHPPVPINPPSKPAKKPTTTSAMPFTTSIGATPGAAPMPAASAHTAIAAMTSKSTAVKT